MQIVVEQFICLTYEGLREFIAQHSSVEPIEIIPAIGSCFDNRIEQMAFASIFITKDVLLGAFVQNKLSALAHVIFQSPATRYDEDTTPSIHTLVIGLNAPKLIKKV